MSLSPKERLRDTLRKKRVDRPPVICSGGMMNAAIVDVMEKTGHTLPEAHFSGAKMAALAEAVSECTGFENIGVPFCMTVEAELFGSRIDHGTLACEPKIQAEAFSSLTKVEVPVNAARGGRTSVVGEAVELLSKRRPDLPVVATLTGPVSVAASIVDPTTFLKELRTRREDAHRVLAQVTAVLAEYAGALISAGATVIAIGDPTATVEILGPQLFQEYAIRYLNDLAASIHALATPVIVHICGKMGAGARLLPGLASDAISVDAMIDLKGLKVDAPGLTTMGNLSTYLLQWGSPQKIADRAVELVEDGVNIIAPACGLSTSTTLANITAMTRAVQTARERAS
jgi:[methyl-Co(III) methanol-specific corrinoid protein]:coenzyme M methyltransferase